MKKYLVEYTSSLIIEARNAREAGDFADQQLPVQALVQRVEEYEE